jgi:hypothetical protein
VVRTVEQGGGCSWNGTELSCDCVPKYAPEPCESVLGPPPSFTSSASNAGTVFARSSSDSFGPAAHTAKAALRFATVSALGAVVVSVFFG